MGQMDHDRPDDSNAPRHDKDSVAEETSAAGQRAKGAIKEAAGKATGNESLEEKGDRENQAGKIASKRTTRSDLIHCTTRARHRPRPSSSGIAERRPLRANQHHQPVPQACLAR